MMFKLRLQVAFLFAFLSMSHAASFKIEEQTILANDETVTVPIIVTGLEETLRYLEGYHPHGMMLTTSVNFSLEWDPAVLKYKETTISHLDFEISSPGDLIRNLNYAESGRLGYSLKLNHHFFGDANFHEFFMRDPSLFYIFLNDPHFFDHPYFFDHPDHPYFFDHPDHPLFLFDPHFRHELEFLRDRILNANGGNLHLNVTFEVVGEAGTFTTVNFTDNPIKRVIMTDHYPLPSNSAYQNGKIEISQEYIDLSMLTFSEANGELSVTDCNTSASGALKIPASYNGKPVTSIGDNAFKDCKNITSATIPDSVTSIGNYAFRECSNLESVTIPNSVTSIGNYAFAYCTSLPNVTIPKGVKTIGDNAFRDCSNLESVSIPDSVTSIGNYAFAYCRILPNVTIPEGVQTIGDNAFRDCSKLKSVTISDSVTSIGNYAFAYCRILPNVTIPKGVKTIGDNAFRDCSNLESVSISDSVTSIGNYAFAYCTSLPNVTIPKGVQTIGDNAFRVCEKLTSVTIPDSVTSIGNYAFAYCKSLPNVTIPDSVQTIGNYAFRDCEKLTSVTFEGNVEGNAPQLGNNAFQDYKIAGGYIVGPGVDLKGANLAGIVGPGVDLKGANLAGANLAGANLAGADLTNAELEGADLEGADLEEANLEGADLSSSILIDTRLNAAYMKFAILTKANLKGAKLNEADLRGADLTGANLTGASLTEADLTGANLTGANLTNAELSGSILIDARLNAAYVKFASLRGAILEEAQLNGADLTGANLEGAYLKNADLEGADLTGANLTGATLTNAELSGSILIDARLNAAYVKFAILTKSNLKGAKLNGADLTGANLEGADLSGADLMDANLTKAKLQGAALFYAHNPHGIIQANPGGEITGIPKTLPKWFQVVDGYIKEVTDPPVIVLIGNNPLTVEAATNFNEPGASVSDDKDGELDLNIDGFVDTNTLGSYIRTYETTDSTGNTTKVTRQVNVVDTTKPDLSVDWEFDFKKHEAGEEFKYPAATASDTVDGDVTDKIVRTSNIVNSKKPGDDYFIKYEVKDAADNETTKTLPVYIVDTTAPVIEVKDALILRKIGDSLNDPGVTVTDNAEGVPAPKVTNNSSEKVDLKNTGKYVVTYTATDDASNSSSATRTFVVLPSPELNGIATKSYPNSEVKIPFRVKDFNKLTAMSLKMEWDKDLLQLVRQGKNPQLLADSSLVSFSNFNFEKPGSLSFLWMASLQQTSGLTLPDDTVLFSLYFKLVGPAGEKGVIKIPANTFLTSNVEGYEDSITESSTDAIIEITDKADITGEVSFWGDTAKPISVASIVLASSSNENRNSKSESNGDFAIADTKISDSYEISADYQDKDNEHANKGVNVLDLIKIRKHILAKAPFERPFSLIAADVDRNKTIDVMDLVAIRKVILMKQKYYKSSNADNSNWQFLSTDFQVANISESFDAVVKFQKRKYTGEPWHITGADFIGIKLGDVNGDWWTNPANNNLTKMNRFNTHDALVKFGSGKNEGLNIPLYATSGKNLMGIELEMSWDPDVVELEDVSSPLLGMSFSDGNINIGEGSVSIVWDDPFVRGVLVDSNSPLFDFNFARIGEGATGMTIKSGMMVDSQERDQSIQPASAYVHADNRFKPAMNGLIKNIELDGDQVVLVIATDKQRAYELQSASSLIEQHWNKHSIFEGNGQWQEIVVEREKVDTYLRAVPIIENVE